MAQRSPVECEVKVGNSVSCHCISHVYLPVCHKSHCRDESLWKRAQENNEPCGGEGFPLAFRKDFSLGICFSGHHLCILKYRTDCLDERLR